MVLIGVCGEKISIAPYLWVLDGNCLRFDWQVTCFPCSLHRRTPVIIFYSFVVNLWRLICARVSPLAAEILHITGKSLTTCRCLTNLYMFVAPAILQEALGLAS